MSGRTTTLYHHPEHAACRGRCLDVADCLELFAANERAKEAREEEAVRRGVRITFDDPPGSEAEQA